MMALARTVVDYPHAVQRDLLCHGFRWAGLGDPEGCELDLRRFVSFVLGAPPASALGHALNEGWTQTDHLIANLGEQHAQLISLSRRYPRPGLPEEPEVEPEPERLSPDQVRLAVATGSSFDRFDSIAAFEAKRREFHARILASQTKELEEVTS